MAGTLGSSEAMRALRSRMVISGGTSSWTIWDVERKEMVRRLYDTRRVRNGTMGWVVLGGGAL